MGCADGLRADGAHAPDDAIVVCRHGYVAAGRFHGNARHHRLGSSSPPACAVHRVAVGPRGASSDTCLAIHILQGRASGRVSQGCS